MAEEKASSEGTNAGGQTPTGVAAGPPPSAAAEEPLPADRAAGPTEKGGTEDVAAPSAASADGRSFSQLLAGAMASPAASPRSGAIVTVPVVALPCFLTPAALVDSQGLTAQFAMTHQAVLATVTAQAQMQLQAACPSSSSNSITNVCPMPLQQIPPPTPKKIPGDVYNWRKYGQKPVKSSENARSYYRCTDPNCSAKKKVEHCPDGTVVEVIYRGIHNHDPPQKHRYTRDRGVQSSVTSLENGSSERPNTEAEKLDNSACKPEQNSSNETPKQQLFCSSDCEFDAGTKSEEDVDDEPDPKRRLSESSKISSAPILKTIREYIVQTEIDARHLSDGYRWRKYGQKIVKGNSNPRSYYRCTHSGCPVRKHVERVSNDAKALLITYEGEHNHEQPTSKFASDSPLPALKNSSAAGVAEERLLITYEGEPNRDQPTSKFASDSPQPAPKSNVTAGAADEQVGTSNDPPLAAPESDAAAAVADEQLSVLPLSIIKPSDDEHMSTAVEEGSGDGNLELGGDQALESAQALLSMGFSSTPSGEKNARNSPDGMKSPILTETPAAVSVQNT